MSVLTRDALLAEIAAGGLALDPFDPAAVGPASIDLTLGDEIRVLSPGPDPIPIREDADFRDTPTWQGSMPAAARAHIHGSRASASRCRPTCAGCSRGAAASRGSG
jgi:hypothetical protein